MLKIKVKLLVIFILLSASLVFIAIFAHADTTKRIKFAKGKISATVKGAVLRDEIDTYLINVGKGQKMTVKVTSVEKNASFRIRNVADEYVEGAGELDDPTDWSGTIDESGDYKIEVAPDRGNATYSLTVSVVGSIETASQSSKTDCAISGWIEDKELEKDIFIRETPDPSGKIIGEIPAVMEEGDETIVEITGYSNGWLKIQKAMNLEDKVIFEGSGWIRSNRVTANVQRPDGNSEKGATLYAQPKSSGKKVGTIPSETLIEIVGFDCFGLKVKYKGKTGWISKGNICGNPVTTCS